MEFYNRHFHQLICHLDPEGMLNVSVNVYANARCIQKYFRTELDFRKLDLPWMCDQLMTLLINFDETVAVSSSLEFLQNDFQRIKYPLILISEAFIGLVMLLGSSVDVFDGYCKSSTKSLYLTRTAFLLSDEVPTKKRRKRSIAENVNVTNQPHQLEIIQNQQIEQPEFNQVAITGFENIHTLTDVNLIPGQQILQNINCEQTFNNEGNVGGSGPHLDLNQQSIVQPIGEFPVPDQNVLPSENLPLPSNLLELPMQFEEAQLIEQPRHSQRILDMQVQADQLTVTKDIVHVPEGDPVPTESNVSQDLLLNRPVKRRISNNRTIIKKRPIELSKKALVARMKRLEGELHDRPLENLYMKYIVNSVDHLPLRYALHKNQSNILFRTVTLRCEMEENKNNEDDVLNDTMDMTKFKAITEQPNQDSSSNNCIYQQAVNNSLPHLSVVPFAEEYSSNNSLEWRHAIHEINRKLGDTLKDTSPIDKIDQHYKDKLKIKIRESLVSQKTLMEPDLPHVELPINIDFPLLRQTEELFDNRSLLVQPQNAPEMQLHANIENNLQMLHQTPPAVVIHSEAPQLLKSPGQLNINNTIDVNNQQLLVPDVQDAQNNVEPAREKQQSIDVVQILTNILEQSPEVSRIRFTDLCPLYVTIRQNAVLVMKKLLQLHKEKVIKLSQPYDTSNPSSISIEFINF